MSRLNYVKALGFSALLCLVISTGCNKSGDNKMIRSSDEFAKLSNPNIMIDTTKLMSALQSKFPADTVLRYFGPGAHSFYLVVGRGADSDHMTYLFTQNIGLIGISSPDVLMTDLLKIGNSGSPFEQGYFDNDQIFRRGLTADDKATAKVIGIYELRTGFDKTKKVIYPWSIQSADLTKYQLKFEGGYNRNEFLSNGFPRAMMGGYEELSKKISYPEEARKLGVNGRIMIFAYVDEKGNVVGTQLSQGIGFGCDEAALSAIRLMKFYPSDFGKSEVIVPIDFALEYASTSFDLTSTKFNYDPRASYNNIYFNLINLGKLPNPESKSSVFLYIDKELAFASLIPKVKKEVDFYMRWDKVKKGVHEYTISIDPLNNLKETNRSNNIISGSFEVR